MWIIAGLVATLLTFFDLDRTFYIPSKTQEKTQLRVWLLSFPLANGILASLLYTVVGGMEGFSGVPKWLASLIVGVGYLAIVRLKLATVKVQDQEVPLGIELFYDAAKEFVYRRVNRIAMKARYEETIELAQQVSLSDLAGRAKLSVEQDALLTPQERIVAKAWIVQIIKDTETDEMDKRKTLANYVLSGQRIE
jgi:hypothetical protein